MDVDWQQFSLSQDCLPKRPAIELDTYTRYYAINVNKIEGNDHYLYVHNNGLAIMGLSPLNFLIKSHVEKQWNILWKIPPADNTSEEMKTENENDNLQEGEKMEQELKVQDENGTELKEIKADQNTQNEIGQQVQKMEEDSENKNQIDQEEKETEENKQIQNQDEKNTEKYLQIAVDFGVSGTDLSDVTVTGRKNKKNKNAGHFLKRKGPALCRIKCGDKEVDYNIQVRSKLLEANQRLLTEPQLLVQKPCTEGFLAIVQLVDMSFKSVVSQFKTPEQYCSLRGVTSEYLL